MRQCPSRPRRAGVGLDAVAQFHRHPSGSNAAGHGGGVQVLSPQSRVRRLPPALLVFHLHDIGQLDVVVWGGVAQAGGGMAGMGVDEPSGRRSLRCLAPPAPHLAGDVVQVSEGGVAFGVHDPVHVFGLAHHAELGHALVGGDHDLHPRPARLYQPVTAARVPGPARAEDRLVSRRPTPPRSGRATRLPPSRPRPVGSRPGRRSTPWPGRGGRLPARARWRGGTRPTLPPSSASSPLGPPPQQTRPNFLASQGLAIVFSSVGGLPGRESLVKGLYWVRAVVVNNGNERSEGI